ncbi:hypothetical protein AVO43_08330 [Microbulbifer sp. ZGT114]|nr:hypothetical protein AVO43_08330 [Microbulbifer sp. ZGT114]
MRLRPRLLALAICLGSAACSNQTVKTLADLPPATLPAETVAQPAPVDVATLQRSYERALVTSTDPHQRRQIELRLADLEMERLEQLQADDPASAVSYRSAVKRYEALAAAMPEDDYVLYRLARARAIDGDPNSALQALDHIASVAPGSPFMAEVLFRRGEAAFNRRDYRAAAEDFERLLARGDSPFSDNARYMLGWSQLKSSEYPRAAGTFLDLLDQLSAQGPLLELPSGQRRLAEDSLRGLSLTFSYQGGADAIETASPQSAGRDYQHLLYRALGDWYTDKERFRESADTFLAYVEHYPHSPEAPALHLRAIETLQNAALTEEIQPAKREFVQRYGIRSAYWQDADESQRTRLREWLKPWLVELAKFDHARAQALTGEAGKSAAQQRQLREEAQGAYTAAATLYRQYEETFPDDASTPEMVFLLAECLTQLDDQGGAWEAYSRVAWQYQDKQRAAEAGYAAVLAAAEMSRRTPSRANQGAESTWQHRDIATSLHFAESWPAHQYALPVQLAAAEKLLGRNQWPEAIAAAEKAAGWQPPPNRAQQQNLNLVLGHSHFALKAYAEAERAYGKVLSLSQPEDRLYAVARERLQAAIYQQAQLALAAGDQEAAIGHLLRVRQGGRTEIAATAQYDAINLLIEMQAWTRASAELADFRQQFPTHALTPTLAAKAVVIFQALQMPGAAAGEFLRLAQQDADSEVRRQSLFMAAESFQQAGDQQQAIATYRQYSERWPQPAEQRLEAQYQLLQLLGEKDPQRNRWLRTLAGNPVKTERGRYLAASAQSELAEQHYQDFARITLGLPLDQSLGRKRAAMEKTVAEYRKVLQFNIAEFTTQASFRLAEVYRQLSRDLMESQRPPGLDALALEQYEILLEEQAFPFEEKAIELHEANIQRTTDGIYDDWIKRSFDSLGKLLPARYQKDEKLIGWSDALH